MYFPLFFTLAASILAAPAIQSSGCDVSKARLDLPSPLAVPSGLRPNYITLGIGTQNYTCSSTGSYASAGAVATLIDIGCLYESDPELFKEAQEYAYNVIGNWDKIEAILGPYIPILGKHYFIAQDGAIAPKFDFSQSGKGYVIAKRTNGAPSPDGSQNVDWLELQGTSGDLAQHVFRVDTKQGQPPASCTAGQTITVPYTTKYWFFA